MQLSFCFPHYKVCLVKLAALVRYIENLKNAMLQLQQCNEAYPICLGKKMSVLVTVESFQ